MRSFQTPSESGFSVLVAGGTGTLGGAIVAMLAARGDDVTALYHRDELRAQAVQRETGCRLLRADACDENALAQALQMHRFEAMVHGVGIARDALLMRQSVEDWNAVLQTNLTSAFVLAKAALSTLPRGAKMVFLASRVGENGAVGQGAYAASKAALLALMQCVAAEGGNRNIAANAVCPGFVPSAMTAQVPERELQRAKNRSAFAELGSAAHTAQMVAWLLSPAADGISGQVFHADSRIR